MIELSTGGGQTVQIDEPTRETFEDNLRGALLFGLAHILYDVLGWMGNALGSFISGIAVGFLERLEPEFVTYVEPLIDELLDMDELPDVWRTFLTKLKTPTAPAGASLLAAFGSSASGAIVGSTMNVLLAPLTYALNDKMRLSLLSVSELHAAYRRGLIDLEGRQRIMGYLGYNQEAQDALEGLFRLYPSADDMLLGLRLGTITNENVIGELQKQGFTQPAIDLLLDNNVRPFELDWSVNAYRRGLIDHPQLANTFAQHGYNPMIMETFLRASEQLLGVGDVLRAYHRQVLTEPQALSAITAQGYNAETASKIMELSYQIPGPNDLIRMSLREAFDENVVNKWGYDADYPKVFQDWMEKQGFDPSWSKYYWRSHWELPPVMMGFDMLHRGIIDTEDMRELLRIQDYPVGWRDKMMAISYNPITRVDVRRMYQLGVIDRTQVKRRYLDIGYNAQDAELMTQFTEKYQSTDVKVPEQEYRDLTRSVVIDAYKKKVIDQADATTRLMGLGYETHDIGLLLSLADWQKSVSETPDYMSEYRKDIVAIIERAYTHRLIDHDTASGYLRDVDLSDGEITYKLQSLDTYLGLDNIETAIKAIADGYVSRAITRTDVADGLGQLGLAGQTQEDLLGLWDMARNLRSRRLTEAQYRKAWSDKIINEGAYIDALRGLGYTDYDIDLLIKMYGK